jgi:5-methylcytosine-specific restriction endonuclease McrA
MNTQTLIILFNRTDTENCRRCRLKYLDNSPDFQREYESWDDKLKTRLIETLILKRAMNPIWTVYNDEKKCDEILDGMHRIKTSFAFMNNEFKIYGKYLTELDKEEYDGKLFKDLDDSDKHDIDTYPFIINELDSSYRTDIDKLRDMYNILNRSSKTLNEFELNKVLYRDFYKILSEYKTKDEIKNILFKKIKDSRGNMESQLMEIITLSGNLPMSWSSIHDLVIKWHIENLGDTSETVHSYLEKNTKMIHDTFKLLIRMIQCLNNGFSIFSKDSRTFNSKFIPYKFILSRLLHKFTTFKHFIMNITNIIPSLKTNILEVDIQSKLECKTRNAKFQQKLINLIDTIIEDNTDTPEHRHFSKEDRMIQLKKQKYQCSKCNIPLNDCGDCEADHITPFALNGKTHLDNLQMLCIKCHTEKTKRDIILINNHIKTLISKLENKILEESDKIESGSGSSSITEEEEINERCYDDE